MARILYFCFASPQPTGGDKVIYRHVALLNQLGFKAWVVHPQTGF